MWHNWFLSKKSNNDKTDLQLEFGINTAIDKLPELVVRRNFNAYTKRRFVQVMIIAVKRIKKNSSHNNYFGLQFMTKENSLIRREYLEIWNQIY
jgi:hypothetical protein